MANNNHFDLTLDTLGPSGAVKRPVDFEGGESQYIKANSNLRITKGDAVYMKLWFNGSAAGSKTDQGYVDAAWVNASTSALTSFVTAGNYYYHLVLKDDVENESAVYDTAIITFDSTSPQFTEDPWLEDKETQSAVITNQSTVALKASFSDNLSGVVKLVYKETTTDVVDTFHEVAVSGTSCSIDVTFKTGTTSGIIDQGEKTYEVYVVDACGNRSLSSTDTAKILYDTELTKPVIAFLSDDFGNLPTYINYHGDTTATPAERAIYLQLACADTDVRAYRIWEDVGGDAPAWITIPSYAINTAYSIYSPVIHDNKVYTSNDDITAEENKSWADVSSKFDEGLNVGKAIVLSANDGLKVARGEVKDAATTTKEADYIYRIIDTKNPVGTISSNKDIISNVENFNTAVITLNASDDTNATGSAYQAGVAYTIKTCIINDGKKYFVTADITATENTGWSAIAAKVVLANNVSAWAMKVGSTQVHQGTGPATGETFNLTSANSMVEGGNTVSIEVVDLAGNEGSANCTVILDTTAPSGVIANLDTWYKEAFAITVNSIADANYDAQHPMSIQAWKSTTPADTTAAGTVIALTGEQTKEIAAANIGGNYAQSNANYMHIKLVDCVGNVVYDHKQFGYDDAAPTGSLTFTKTSYPTTSAQVVLSYNDATSGVTHYKVYGTGIVKNDVPITEQSAEWTAVPDSGLVFVTLLGGEEGDRVACIKYKDAAENVSDEATATTHYDPNKPSGTIKLRNADDTADKEAHSKDATFAAQISTTETVLTGIKYQIYGDFTVGTQAAQGISYKACTLYAPETAYAVGDLVLHEGTVYKFTKAVAAADNKKWADVASSCAADDSVWKDLVYDKTGYKLESNLVCTTGDGLKTAYVVIMDKAGNISTPASAGFTYDTTLPDPQISGVDYYRISKIHNLRHSAATVTIAGKYADETHFTVTPGETIQAYKVCAYEDAEAAIEGSYEDPAIPQTGDTVVGLTPTSVNMHATGISSSDAISCTIAGADYEYALGGVSTTGEHDGAHIVVVYVQDLAGQWSAAAIFGTYYNLTPNLTHVTAAGAPARIEPSSSIAITITPEVGYSLPNEVSVTSGVCSYTWNAPVLTISNATGDVTYSVVGVPEITVEGGTAKGVTVTKYSGAEETALKNELISGGQYTSESLASAALVNMTGTQPGTVVLNVASLGEVGDPIKIMHKKSNNEWEVLYNETIPANGLVTVTLTSFSPIVACKVEVYTITPTLSHVTADSSNPTSVREGNEVTLVYTSDEGYTLPSQATIAATLQGASIKSWTVEDVD